MGQVNCCSKADEAAVKIVDAVGIGSDIQIYGLPGSMNCMGPVLLVMYKKLGNLVPTMIGPDGTAKPEFRAMNPYGQIPTMKDAADGTALAETCAMLRYIATKHAPELYPPNDPVRAAFIDWAMDNFVGSLYKDAVATIYPLLGYAEAPADRQAVGKAASSHLQEFADFFLRGQFIGGTGLSIADFRIAPFFFCFAHPAIKAQSYVECPSRILRFVEDFQQACGSPTDMLNEAGGWGLKEMLDKKHGSVAEIPKAPVGQQPQGDSLKRKDAGKGGVKIYGATGSMNCMSVILLGLDAKCGELVPTMPGTDTMKKEFLALNPFHAIPTIQDGEYPLAESSAILRYLSKQYAPLLYPSDLALRGRIDWAMDNFSSNLYKDFVTTVYPCFGYGEYSKDMKEVGKALGDKVDTWCTNFLKGKFVGGDALSIADYKIAPFFFAWAHPMIKQKSSFEVPARVVQYNRDFAAASGNSKMFTEAGGYSLKEMLDKNQKEHK